MKLKKIIGIVQIILKIVSPFFKSPKSITGVKEFRELLKGCLCIALLLIRKFKDGVQYSDFNDFYETITSDTEFNARLFRVFVPSIRPARIPC